MRVNPEKVQIKDDRVIAPAQTVALIFGITPRTLTEWAKKGCPKVKTGWYDVGAVMQWRHSSENTPDSLEKKKQIADIRYREARADMEELKQKEALGQYVAVNQIEDILRETFAQVRTTLLALGQKVMSDIYSQYPDVAFDVKHVVEREIERGLTQLASGSGQLTEGGFKPKPAPKPKRGRPKKSK